MNIAWTHQPGFRVCTTLGLSFSFIAALFVDPYSQILLLCTVIF